MRSFFFWLSALSLFLASDISAQAANPAKDIPRAAPPESLPDPADLVPWPLSPYPELAAGSVVNASSWLLDAPAGKHGVVRIQPDGQLAFEDGTPARFWGTTTVFGMSFPDTVGDIEKLADAIAASGYNMVRFHHNDINRTGLGYLQENPKSNSRLNPKAMDTLDRFAAELYKRGVYVYLDFADFRSFQSEDGLDDWEALNKLDNKGWKGVFPHPKIVEAWKRAVTEFLNHVNPYTGRKWGQEPGVVTVEIINENGQFWDWNFKITDSIRAWHQQEWNKWLLAKSGTREKLDAQWTDVSGNKGLFADEDPSKGNVFAPKLGRYLEWERPYRSKTRGTPRVNDWYAFLTDQATNFYKDASQHIRNQGFKGIIIGSHELQGPSNQYAEVQGTGTIAAHLYAGGLTSWNARPGVRGVAVSGVDVSTNNWYSNLPRIKVRGTPGINGEWTGRTLTRSADVNLAVSAMTALQRVTQSLHFSFGHRWVGETVPDYDFSYKWQEYKKAIGFTYSSMHDVPWMAVNRICASLFARSDFHKPNTKAHIAFSATDRQEQNLHALGLSGGGGTIGDAALFLPVLHEVECAFFDVTYEGDADVVFMTGRSASGDYRKARHAVLVGDNPFTDIYHKIRDLGLPARTIHPGVKITDFKTPSTFTVSWPWPEEKQLSFDSLEGAIEVASIPKGARPIGLSSDGKFTLGWLDDHYLVLPNGRAFQEKISDVQWLYRLYLAACQRWKIDTADNAAGETFLQSDTRELTIDWAHGTTIVDTERTQGFSGLMGWRKENTTGNIEASLDIPYGNVLATSADGKPLGESKRILLVAAGRMQNTGQVLGVDSKGFPNYTKTGNAPAMIEGLRGQFSLSSKLASGLKVYALDVKGRRLGEVPTSVQNGRLSFPLSPKWGTLWYEITTTDSSGPAAPGNGVWPLEEKMRAAAPPAPDLISLADYFRIANKSLSNNPVTKEGTTAAIVRVIASQIADKSFHTYGNIQAEVLADAEKGNTIRARFGKVNQGWAGGFFTMLDSPADPQVKSGTGFGFSFKGDGTMPREAYLSLKGDNDIHYRSKNLNKLFENDGWQEVVLKDEDFEVSPELKKSNPDLAKTLPLHPDWASLKRADFVCIGPLMDQASVGQFGSFFFVVAKPGQESAAGISPVLSSLPAAAVPASNKLTIPFLSKADPKTDGIPDEEAWKISLALNMDEEKVPDWHFFGSHVVEGKRLQGEGGRFWFYATEAGLALTADIRNGKADVVAERADWYQNDCLEVLVDSDGKGGKPDKQLFLAYRLPKNDQASASDPSIRIGRSSAGADGYVLEALIPWVALGFKGKPTEEFGLELQVDFARPGLGRALQMVYGTGTNEAFIQSDNYLKVRIQP